MKFLFNFISFRFFSSNTFAKTIEDSALGYRLQGKSFLLTYSQVKETDLETFSQNLIKKLNPSFPVDSLTVVCELHKDKGRHFHAVVSFKKRIHSRDPKAFDVDNFHPNISIARTPKKALEYVLKDIAPGSTPSNKVLFSTFKIEELAPLFGVYEKKAHSSKAASKAAANAAALAVYNDLTKNNDSSVLSAIDTLLKSDPVSTLKNYQKLFVNLVFIKSQHADYSASYIDFFKFDLMFAFGIHAWLMQKIKTHVLCIMGPTRSGKSSIALQIIGKHPLVINEINGLVRLIPGHHTSIVFNDFDFDDLSKTKLSQYLALFDSKQPSSLRILFQSIHIPAYVPKIVTSNNDLSALFSNYPALHARHVFVYASRALKLPSTQYEFNLNKKNIGIPCAYDKDGKFIENKHFCISSVAIFSFIRYLRKQNVLEKNFRLFLKLFPFSLNEIHFIILKSLDSMYYDLRQRFPEHYSFFHIYHFLQFYHLKNKNNFDIGKFFFICEPIYHHYKILTETPKKTYYTNIFDIIYLEGPNKDFAYDFSQVGSQVDSNYDAVTDSAASDAYVPHPVFSSYVNEKDIKQNIVKAKIDAKPKYTTGNLVPSINKVIDINSITISSPDMLESVFPSVNEE